MYTQLFSVISNLFSNFFEFKKTQIENQTTTNIIKDKKDYKKATNIAEKIIKICIKYKLKMSLSDRLKLKSLITTFNKYN